MKTLVTLLLTVFRASLVFSQQVIVVNEKRIIVYCGIQNPLTAVVNGFPCKAIILKTTNGKIEKTGCGRFSYTPDHVGTTRVEVYTLWKNKLFKKGYWPFKIEMLPSPIAFVTVFAPEEGRYRPTNKDTVHKQWLSPFSGVRAILPTLDYEAPFSIVSYTISAYRNDSTIFSQLNTGSRFEIKMIPHFDCLQPGDHLIFSNIICTGPSLCNRQNPQPIKYYVDR